MAVCKAYHDGGIQLLIVEGCDNCLLDILPCALCNLIPSEDSLHHIVLEVGAGGSKLNLAKCYVLKQRSITELCINGVHLVVIRSDGDGICHNLRDVISGVTKLKNSIVTYIRSNLHTYGVRKSDNAGVHFLCSHSF